MRSGGRRRGVRWKSWMCVAQARRVVMTASEGERFEEERKGKGKG